MMSNNQLKQKLHNYIDTADDNKLNALYTLLEGDITAKAMANKAKPANKKATANQQINVDLEEEKGHS